MGLWKGPGPGFRGKMTQTPYHNLPIEQVLETIDVDPGQGLTSELVRRRLQQHGPNRLTRAHWTAVGGWATLLAACVFMSLSMAVYGMGLDHGQALTISFLTLAFSKLWFVFILRHPQSGLLDNAITRNPYMWGALMVCVVLLLAAVYLPGLSDVLKTVSPGSCGWLVIIGMSLLPFAAGQAMRVMQKQGRSRR